MGGELEQKSELILIPAPAVGHLVSAGEFAKRLLSHSSSSFSHVTLLLIKPPYLAAQLDAFTASLTASEPRITCVDLPPAPPPPLHLFPKSEENFYTLYIEAHAQYVREAVQTQQTVRQPAAFILDFFCSSFADIANEMNIPSYIYLPSGAAMLALMLYLPTRHLTTESVPEFTGSEPDSIIPGFANPIPSRVLPSALFNTEGGYTAYLKMAKRFRSCKGIIVNTFPELESYALSSLAADKGIPPIYPVGPVIDLKGEGQDKMGCAITASQRIKILGWLDQQPEKSVAFLCFGSMVGLCESQIKEIANGLEKSRQRFLWSFRGPEGCPDVTEMLPEGFADRTREIGMVCGWVPQVEILAHGSIGGFVSHCGWNSILESFYNGVPVATWSMYAEQQLNSFMLVNELGAAVELRGDYRKDMEEVVPAEEVEAAVREVLKRESKARGKAEELREKSRAALEEGGPSYVMMGQLAEDMLSSTGI